MTESFSGETAADALSEAADIQLDQFEHIPLDQLVPYHAQARKDFDAEQMQSLADSIRTRGVVQPISVRPYADGKYEILAGERRWRAARMAGLQVIPATIKHVSESEATVVHLVENIQRENLALPEVAEGLTLLVKQVGLEKAAHEVGKSKSWVSKRTGLMELPEPVRNAVSAGLVRDVEMAGLLGQLHALDHEEAESLIEVLENPQDEEPVTRESVRQCLQFHQRRIEERQRRESPPPPDEQPATGNAPKKIDPREAAQKKRERQIALAKEERKQLKEACVEQIKAALGFTEKQLAAWNSPLRVDYVLADFPGFNNSAKVPLTGEDCNFDFRAHGDIDLLTRLADGFKKKPEIRAHLPLLTLDQARRLSTALADVEEFHLTFEETVSGKELKSIAARLSQKKSAPVPAVSEGAGSIEAFIAQRLDRSDPKARVKSSDLHAAYAAFCKKSKVPAVSSSDNAWAQALVNAGIERVRSNGIHYVGISLKA